MKVSSSVEICNLALLRIGQDSIPSFEDNTSLASKKCRLIYEQSKSFLLSQYSWTFALKTFNPNVLDNLSSIKEYKYKYSLPVNFLRLVGVYDSFGNKVVAIGPMKKPYVLEGQSLLTDLKDIAIKYVHDVDVESDFSAMFIECLVLDLAIRLTKVFNDSSTYLQQLQMEFEAMISKAKVADCHQTMLDGITSYPILYSTWEF